MQDPSQEPDKSPQNPGPDAAPYYPLASRMQRLAASLLDEFIAALVLLPVLGYYDVFSYFQTETVIPVDILINVNKDFV